MFYENKYKIHRHRNPLDSGRHFRIYCLFEIYRRTGIVYIFQRLGMESAGRYGFAVMETITLVLLLIPRTAWRGAMLGGLMTFGAICMHLTIVEINILGDGGLLFASAIVALVACFSIMVMHRTELETELN